MAERFVLIASLDDCRVTDTFRELPAHITIVPPFQLQSPNTNIEKLDEALHDRLAEEGPLTVVGQEAATYGGVSEEVTVREVGGVMFSVHAACYALIKHFGGMFDERYTGIEWSPHVTKIHAIDKDETRRIEAVQLLRYLPHNIKWVVGVYPLSSRVSNETTT